MDWPSIEDYRTALQNPCQVFRDAWLQACQPELNRMGLPRGRAGGYAIVYRMSSGTRSTALRVLLHRPKPDREKRYRMVHTYLQKTRPRCLIDFGYDPEGIIINGQGFPILTMEWVEGQQLGEWLRGMVELGDTRAIKAMADAWIELVGELRSHGIAHGDLQHGNILVVGDRPVLVDYDCMYVPTMVSDEDREAWEFGMPGYQHPDRVGKRLGPEFDNFSAWAILVALRAVADDPDLWRRHVFETESENLLFSREDIEFPERSVLWPELIANACDRKVREWSAQLRSSLDNPFEAIPPFGIDIFDPLRAVIAAGDWRQIQELASSRKYASKSFPGDVAGKVQEATMRIESLDQLEAKVRSGRIREIAAAYRPTLIDDWADAALVAEAQKAVALAGLLDELAAAAHADPGGRQFAKLWQERGAELEGVLEAQEFRDRAEGWRRRTLAAELLEQAVAAGDETAIAEAWLALAESGGHPDAEVHRERAEGAVRRLDAWRKLAGLSRRIDEPTDRALLQVWAVVSGDLDERNDLDLYRARVELATQRQALLGTLIRTIEEADQGRRSEQDVVDAAKGLPTGYVTGLVGRIHQAHERVGVVETLVRALRTYPQSDLVIASAAKRAKEAGCWPRDPAEAARCLLAWRRRSALASLDAISRDLLLDESDAQWAARWDAALLDGCHDAAAYRERYELAIARASAAAELESALAACDAATVKRLSRDSLLTGHPSLERLAGGIESLIASSERIERMLEAAREGHSRAFFAEADPAFLAAHSAVFAPHRSRIEGWVDCWLGELAVLRPAEPMFVKNAATGVLIARWSWLQQRVVSTCLLAADPRRFFEKPDEARDITHQVHPDAYRREQSGSAVLVPPGSRQMFVTIWPVVDLGWTRCTGPPMRLGPHNILQDFPAPAGTSPGSTSPRKQFTDWLVRRLNEV